MRALTTLQELGEKIKRCFVELNEDCVLNLVREAIARGASASEVVLGPLSETMNIVGEMYEKGEFFLADLVVAAEIFKSVMRELDPLIRSETSRLKGGRRLRVVLGTVKGDVHDIGKTLVAVMLQAAGHEVVDVGVDVSAERFVEAVKTYRPHVLGLSALLTTTASYIKVIIEELERAGLRDGVFIVVGGAATTPEFAKQVGADAWASNALEAVKLLNQVADRLVSRGEARDPR